MTKAPGPEQPESEGFSISNDPRRLSAMVIRLFEHWQLSPADQAHLLGLEKSDAGGLECFRRGDLVGVGQEVWDRVDHLLAIHSLLRMLFPQNRDVAYRWMSTRNRALGHRTPVAVVREEGLEGLQAVRAYLNAAAGA